ncbi:MAG: TadE/TadG family type IV pilus assembly protein [Dehalococcoidia bacterium]
MGRPLRRLADESGSTTVELALVLPVLLIVLLATVQIALVSHARTVVATAAAEGARVAASEGASPSAGTARARLVLRSGLGRGGASYGVSVGQWSGTVVAQVSGGYPLFIPWLGRHSVWLHAQAEVRKEGLRGGP